MSALFCNAARCMAQPAKDAGHGYERPVQGAYARRQATLQHDAQAAPCSGHQTLGFFRPFMSKLLFPRVWAFTVVDREA